MRKSFPIFILALGILSFASLAMAEGAALMTNTNFVWQTFEQVMRRLDMVEVFWHQNIRQLHEGLSRCRHATRATTRKRK